jgi:hypothetical protein
VIDRAPDMTHTRLGFLATGGLNDEADAKAHQLPRDKWGGVYERTNGGRFSSTISSEATRRILIRACCGARGFAWIEREKMKIGYEIPFNRHFYVFEPPRPLADIDADLKEVTSRIKTMIEELTA